MFGIGKRTYDSSMTTIYVFLFILLVNQFFIVNSFRPMYHDTNEVEKSLFGDNDLQSLAKPRFERRFCCMSPLLSGRKRSIQDLTKKKQIKNQQT
ncbi:unnamed protein product [Rotaria sp. Silwood2]|nr:unnamed protein product [Rotaria sp. Silwood2]